ncbi:DUF4030 domain-containing protein [Bacillus clarus]|uniref:DUF4030 domain-containing protein n=1 Tax=Bacillus clarus TaxID=2338372 RepID=A0A090Z3H1_9BACI|nr:DUF4030 domain-containing protein [Bacillus clarus]KFN04710.1 hypothetical protein DJ93_5935 [Bacillus clarus]RFT63869.1 DUF4030 domain-containing protein [Bacillus clarus]
MKKGKGLLLPLLLATLLSACQQNDKEEAKSEGSEVMDTVQNIVGKKGFRGATVDDKTKIVDLEMVGNENENKLKQEINTQLKNQNIKPYTINVSQTSMTIAKIEDRWDMIYSLIYEELFKKNGYKDFSMKAYIELKQPILFAIYTPINSTDSDVREFGKKIEKEVDDLLKTPEAQKWIKNDAYTIEIYSRDKQKIN